MTIFDQNGLILKEIVGKGHGVFAGRSFAPGEPVLVFIGERRDVSELNDLTHALQIGPRTFISASGAIDDFVNHSCTPNTGIAERDGDVFVFALEPIVAGDEITFDYATTQTGGFVEFICRCSSPNCRGTIGDFNDLPEETQATYRRRQAVLPFLLG